MAVDVRDAAIRQFDLRLHICLRPRVPSLPTDEQEGP